MKPGSEPIVIRSGKRGQLDWQQVRKLVAEKVKQSKKKGGRKTRQ